MNVRSLSFIVVAGLTCHFASAVAEEWPTKPITWVVPFPPGGAVDTTGRILQNDLSKELGQTIVIENLPGAGGRLAFEATKRARPDGYKYSVTGAGFSSSPSLLKLEYDPVKDFSHVAFFWKATAVIVVHPSQPYKTLEDLLKAAREKPDQISFGTPGLGTSMHIAGELLKLRADVRLTHVAYRGASQALADVLAGHIPVAITNIGSSSDYVLQGKLRALAVTAGERAPKLPNVPTVAESGFPNFDVAEWAGLAAPRDTPRPIVERMNRAIRKVMASPSIAARWSKMGFQYREMTPEELQTFVAAETKKFADIIERSGMKAD